MKITLTIGGLLILVGGVFIALQPGDVIPTAIVEKVVFEDVGSKVTKSNIGFATSTDEFGNTIRTGIRIPISYETLVPTATGFVVEEVNDVIEMNLDSYDKCRNLGNPKTQCIQELKSDIKQTVDAYEQNLQRDIEELTESNFKNEINNTDL